MEEQWVSRGPFEEVLRPEHPRATLKPYGENSV